MLGPSQDCNSAHYRHLLVACGDVLSEDCVLHGKPSEILVNCGEGVRDATADKDNGEKSEQLPL